MNYHLLYDFYVRSGVLLSFCSRVPLSSNCFEFYEWFSFVVDWIFVTLTSN